MGKAHTHYNICFTDCEIMQCRAGAPVVHGDSSLRSE